MKFTMFGYDDEYEPTTVSNVTAEEAQKIAAAKDLTGMLLAPEPSAQENSRGHMTYMRVATGEYSVVKMHVWVTANLTECTGKDVLKEEARTQKQVRKDYEIFEYRR